MSRRFLYSFSEASAASSLFFCSVSGTFKNELVPGLLLTLLWGAIAALGEITGETVTESVVTRIFSDFCVGK